MVSNVIGMILIITLLIIKSIMFALNVRENHPNNKIHKDKK